MTAKSRMVGLRATHEDAALFTQAAKLSELSTSSWMRENLKRIVLKQVYGKDGSNDFPGTPGEVALFRAVMVILQTVSVGTPDEGHSRPPLTRGTPTLVRVFVGQILTWVRG